MDTVNVILSFYAINLLYKCRIGKSGLPNFPVIVYIKSVGISYFNFRKFLFLNLRWLHWTDLKGLVSQKMSSNLIFIPKE